MFSYGMVSVALTYPIQFNAGRGGERSAQPCLCCGPRAGVSHEWDANGMLQSQWLSAKCAAALHPGWCVDGGVPPHNRSAVGEL